MKFENLDPWAIGQQAAHDTLLQALWHDPHDNCFIKNDNT